MFQLERNIFSYIYLILISTFALEFGIAFFRLEDKEDHVIVRRNSRELCWAALNPRNWSNQLHQYPRPHRDANHWTIQSEQMFLMFKRAVPVTNVAKRREVSAPSYVTYAS